MQPANQRCPEIVRSFPCILLQWAKRTTWDAFALAGAEPSEQQRAGGVGGLCSKRFAAEKMASDQYSEAHGLREH